MIGLVNICAENLVVQKELPIFVMRIGLNSFESNQDIFTTADKAAIPGYDSTQVDSTGSQNKGVVASLYILSKFFIQMRTGKNLTATALGASTSRVDRAKTVSEPKSFLSKGAYINLKGRLNKAERELEELKVNRSVYHVRLVSYCYYDNNTKDVYEVEKEVIASSRAEAIGMVALEMGEFRPNFKIHMIGGSKICTKLRDL